MKLSITLIFLACTSLLMAQSTKIDEEERARLENKFKALKTFYINDDGLVVYHTQGADYTNTNSDEDRQQSPKAIEPATTGYKPVESSRNPQKEQLRDNRDEPYEIVSTNSRNVVSINKRPINPIAAKKVAEEPQVENSKANRIVSIPETNLNKKQTDNTEIVSDNEDIDNEGITIESDKKATKRSSSKKSVFAKPPLKYKDMEEAAMAVDELLEKLRKDQPQKSKSGSMSSRIAKGAGKSTLRKQTLSEDEYLNDYKVSRNRGVAPVTQSILDQLPEENGEIYVPIPTYYINGQKVEKSVADGLKKDQIIRKETRIRNTISGNPAGEVWFEVKENYPN